MMKIENRKKGNNTKTKKGKKQCKPENNFTPVAYMHD